MSLSPSPVYAAVIIPTHDRHSTLAESVRSVQAQTVRDIEIMIIGDGATPSVREVAAGLAGGDSRILFCDWPKTPGLGWRNRLRGIDAARSERIFCNDDDDLFLPHHVEKLGPILDEYDAVDDATASVSLSGRVQISIANNGEGPIRAGLAAGTAKIIFDTHFAHRKSVFQRLDPAAQPEMKAAANLFRMFAGDPAVRWRSLPGVSALSFHGGARRYYSPLERQKELEDWHQRCRRGFAAEIERTAYYDWYLFRLTELMRLNPALDLAAFLNACHIGVRGVTAWPADFYLTIPDDRIAILQRVFALLRKEAAIDSATVELALRLADPLLGIMPRYRRIAALLQNAWGSERAIAALKGHQPADSYSAELRDYSLCSLLLDTGGLDEVKARLPALFKNARFYRAVPFTLAAQLALKRSEPEAALLYAGTAISMNRHIPELHETIVLALIDLGRLDAAQEALARAKVLLPKGGFDPGLERKIREKAFG